MFTTFIEPCKSGWCVWLKRECTVMGQTIHKERRFAALNHAEHYALELSAEHGDCAIVLPC